MPGIAEVLRPEPLSSPYAWRVRDIDDRRRQCGTVAGPGVVEGPAGFRSTPLWTFANAASRQAAVA